MPALIAFRAVQGIGAGAIQPISMTVVGDLYSVAERARVQGYLASVWGVSSVVGPTLGGVFSQYLSWRWIFFVNLPLGAVAAWMLLRHFSEKVDPATAHAWTTPARHCSPWGARWSSSACSRAASRGPGPHRRASPSSPSATALLVAFALVERRAAEPVLPLWVLEPAHAGRGQPHRRGRRGDDDRPQLLRADVRAGRPRHRRPGGRVHPRGADGGLAAGGHVLRPDLHPDRLSRHGADRGGVRPAGRRAVHAAGADHPGVAGRPARASWSGSAWASCPAPSSSRCSRSSAGTGAGS